ncbi:MAG: NAD(P)H-dependent oxidoreductase, partial [Sphingobacterium sp.]
MKHLIVFAHPNSSSLNAGLKEQLTASLIAGGHQIEIRDLYHIGFDPVLSLADMEGQRRGQVSEDVLTEQQFIAWA